jgi:hypothetical protein
MNRTTALLLATTCFLGVAAPAYAHTSQPTQVGHEHEGEAKFPMTAADYRAHIAKRETHMRDHLEKYVTEKGIAKDKADALRATLNAGLAKVDKRVDEVCADGTVTKDEGESVHALIKDLRHEMFGDEAH